MSDTDPAGRQPEPGYREAVLDPVETLVCQRCGALVKQDDTDLHDRFHVSVEQPSSRYTSGTRGA
ncbi:MAG TPA: hypothetical protein VFD04_03465 [Actinomycetes bacterium]|jgi:hypothetical protein|nr:hypothetical protein [Actinomycetes bacterium]